MRILSRILYIEGRDTFKKECRLRKKLTKHCYEEMHDQVEYLKCLQYYSSTHNAWHLAWHADWCALVRLLPISEFNFNIRWQIVQSLQVSGMRKILLYMSLWPPSSSSLGTIPPSLELPCVVGVLGIGRAWAWRGGLFPLA